MAEKEERKGELRIRINQFLWPTCKECGSKCKDEKEIKFCRDSQPGMPRQEAIERIATGYCGGICEKCTDGPKRSEHCIKWLEFRGTMEKAEAALNALLGDK